MRLTHILGIGASLAVLALATPASAETLRDALGKAYAHNPTLTGARAAQRANDENVPLARADALPNLGASADYTENVKRSSTSFTSPFRSASADLTLRVPIYQGGAVANGIRAADTRVAAGVETLRATEASVFSAVVAAYMDVIRDEAIVKLNRENANVLGVNLQATNDRFEVGDLTRTDIAQSQARLALAQSDLQTAEANLISSRERYIQLVGEPPVNLEPPPALPNLPASPDEAVGIAVANNPDLKAAEKQREAARYDIRVAEASRLPRLSAVAQGGYTNFLGSLGTSQTDQVSTQAIVGLQGTIPLFQGGRPGAQVRQAQARSSQTIEQSIAVEREVVAQTRASYASWKSSLQVIESSNAAVSANTLSLEGVRAENSVGNRTILDILNAEQELLIAQVQLVSAQRNAYVAGFSLLAAMGKAEAADLGLDGGTLYDPTINYNRVKGRIWDFDKDPAPLPVATRTVDTPAQNPETTQTSK